MLLGEGECLLPIAIRPPLGKETASGAQSIYEIISQQANRVYRYIHRVSKKTVPTYILLLVCQTYTDFSENWQNCPGINPQQNCT